MFLEPEKRALLAERVCLAEVERRQALPRCSSVDGHGMQGYCNCKHVLDEKFRRNVLSFNALNQWLVHCGMPRVTLDPRQEIP